jgi:GcrA cell cycle regulator
MGIGFWTPERDALVRKWRAEGLGNTAIGNRLGISRSTVSGRAHRLGLATLDGKRTLSGGTPSRPSRAIRSGPVTLEPLQSIAAEPVAAPEPPPPIRLTRECCWPTSPGKPWTFCGAPCSWRYCEEHERRSRGHREAT